MTRPEPAGVGTAEMIAQKVARAVVDAYEEEWTRPLGTPFGAASKEALRQAIVATVANVITSVRRQAKEEDAKIAEEFALSQAWTKEQEARSTTALGVASAIRSSINPPGEEE